MADRRQTMRDPLAHLPLEVFRHMLHFLDALSLHRAAQVSRAWQSAADHEPLWSALAARFGILREPMWGAPSALAWKAALNRRTGSILVLYEDLSLSAARKDALLTSALVHGMTLRLCSISETRFPAGARHVICVLGKNTPPDVLVEKLKHARLPPCNLYLFVEEAAPLSNVPSVLQAGLPPIQVFVACPYLSTQQASYADFRRWLHHVWEASSPHAIPQKPKKANRAIQMQGPGALQLAPPPRLLLPSTSEAEASGTASITEANTQSSHRKRKEEQQEHLQDDLDPQALARSQQLLRRSRWSVLPAWLPDLRWLLLPLASVFVSVMVALLSLSTSQQKAAYKPR